MNVELLLVRDCPHAATAELLLRVALDDVGLSRVIPTRTVINSQDEAERRGFTGSPTFLIEGVDPFAGASQVAALACRLYAHAGGPTGLPDLSALRRALKQAADVK